MEGDAEAMQSHYVIELLKSSKERLSPSEMMTYDSLIQDFKLHRIRETKLITSLLRLFEKDKYHLDQRFNIDVKEDQEDENGETQDDEVTEIERDNLHDTKIEAKREPENYLTNVFDKISLEGNKKRIILQYSDRSMERSLKKTRTLERVTPSYKLIPEKQRSPVSDTVLNNEVVQIKVATQRITKLNDNKDAMTKREYDILMDTLKSAVESANKVMRREMRMEYVGAMFYRCIEKLYREDMIQIVKQHHQKTLPVILTRLKQKLIELTKLEIMS